MVKNNVNNRKNFWEISINLYKDASAYLYVVDDTWISQYFISMGEMGKSGNCTGGYDQINFVGM